jgi:hypothetical protein
MEKEYIENKIKKELFEKDFAIWNKETIKFILHIFDLHNYHQYFNMLLLILNDYIIWYKNNDTINDTIIEHDMYNIDDLINIYEIIKKDMNINNSYIGTLENKKEIEIETIKHNEEDNILDNNNIDDNQKLHCPLHNLLNVSNIMYGIILTIFLIILKYLLSFIFYEKKDEINKHINHNSIPTNLIQNPLIKYLLNNFLDYI